jgi:hypothetical protein
MTWNPLATPPKDTAELLRWLNDHLTAFQVTRPDVPQGAPGSLTDRQRRQLVTAYNRAREDAQLAEYKDKVSAEQYRKLERAVRRGVFVSEPLSGPRTKKPRR